MRLPALLSWFLASASWCFSNEIKTPWMQPCHYVAQHDPVTIVVEEDRSYAVRYPAQSWTSVNDWAKGRELTLFYDENSGAALKDLGTRLSLPLVGWPEDGHPIDLILRQELAETVTTQDIGEAYARAASRWEREVNRAFHLLATCPESGPADRAHVSSAAKAWKKYQTNYLAGVSATLSRRVGTMWGIEAVRHRYTFFREKAVRLSSLLDYATVDLMDEVAKISPSKP
jgi:hypothetical protein